MNRILAFSACLIAGLAAAPASAETVRVGIMNTAPMGGTEPGGYCLDLMSEIGKRAGLELSFHPMPLGELPAAITGNTVDVLCSLHSASNRWREQGLAFTSAILTNAEGLVVRAGTEATWRSLDELAGQPVGVIAGAPTFAQMLADAGAEVREYPDVQATYGAVAAGEVAAALISTPSFLYRQKILGQLADLALVESYDPPPSPVHHVALAVRNSEIALLGRLQAALEATKADGTLTAILDKWALPAPAF